MSSSPRKPGVALALGSGSARGVAHAGIIQVLVEQGIPIRGIAGSSIGAVGGALHSAGALDTWMEVMRGLDRQAVYWFLDPVLPSSGLIGGKRTEKLLRELIGDRQIDLLPLKFCAVCCDLQTGDEVRISQGDVVEAIRASYAIPGVLTPKMHNGRWLTDGGACAPVPVAAAKSMGFEKTIAVDLHGKSFPGPEDQWPTMVGNLPKPDENSREQKDRVARSRELLAQAMDSVTGRASLVARRAAKFWKRGERSNSERPPRIPEIIGDTMAFAQLIISKRDAEIEQPDLVLCPSLPDIGLFDFNRAEELYAEGRRCAEEALEQGLLDPFRS